MKMVSKRKNIFLYLALACFLGIVLIFVFDGYIGIYDRIEVSTGEFPQEVEPDYWLRNDIYWSIIIDWNDIADFTYQVENRRFSGYSSELEVSLWQDEGKIVDLLSEQISIGAFDTWETGWSLDTSSLLPADASEAQGYQFTLLVQRDDVERRIILSINNVPKPVIPRLD